MDHLSQWYGDEWFENEMSDRMVCFSLLWMRSGDMNMNKTSRLSRI